VNVTVNTLAGLSDELEVVLFHGHGNNTPNEHSVLTVAQGTAVPTNGSVDLTIAAPTTNGDSEETDYIEVHVLSDSPVDPTDFSIEITTTAPGLEEPLPGELPTDATLDLPLDIPIVPNVRVFARTDHTAPYVPKTSPDKNDMKAATIEVKLQGIAVDGGNTAISSPAVLTVKTLAGGVVARKAFRVEHIAFPAPVSATLLVGETTLSSFTPEKNTSPGTGPSRTATTIPSTRTRS